MSEQKKNRNEQNNSSVFDELYKIASSIELAVILFAIIGVFTAIGTLIVQNEPISMYYQIYGNALGSLIVKFGFNDLFHSAVYQFLVALFALNLMLCIFTRPFNIYYLGFFAIHISIIIILVGGIVGAIWGDKGYLEMREGEVSNVYTSRNAGKGVQKFPFSIKLNDFTITYKDTPEHRLYVFRKDNREHEASAVLREGKKVAFEGLSSIDTPKMRVVSLHAERMNQKSDSEPVYKASAKINTPNGVLVFDTDSNSTKEFGNFVIRYDIEPLIGKYKSNITIMRENKNPITWNLEVNGPLEVDGYRLYQSNYRKDNNGEYTISGLEVVYDPGIPISFAGFWLLVAGVFWHFYFRPYLLRKRRSAK